MQCMYIVFSSILIILITLSLYFLSYKQKCKNLPPGKICFPVVGESLEFLSAGWKGNPEKFILERISKYSSNVFQTHLFGSPVVAFCGASANKFLFSNENKLVQAWYPKPFDKIFPSSTEENSSSKEESIRMRKLLPNFLKPEGLQRFIGTMDETVQRHFAMDWENKEKVMVYHLTKRFTFSLGCRLFVSIDDESEIDRYSKPFAVLTAGLISVPVDLPLTPFRGALKAAKFLRGELMEIIKNRKKILAEGKSLATHDVLSHMLAYSDENGKFLTETSIADKILGLLLGGHDTSSSACASIVKFLAELPEVYQGVYQEQMEIARSKAPGELLNWEDIQKMRYSWNVVCEVLRLTPPLQGAFRETLANFTYQGFTIPKGWKIYWSVNSTHKNPDTFSDPEKFDPSRFEGSGPSPFTYVPFGGGPRMCPGREYARLEILVFMHHLVRKFKWEKVFPDEKIVYDPLPNPEKGLPVRLFPHREN